MMRLRACDGIFAAVLLLAACDFMSTRVAEGGGSEATNGSLAGAALYPDGSRAAWTSVRIRPAGWLRDTARWERETVPDALADAKGFWHLDSLDTGAFRLELRDGKGRSYAAGAQVAPGPAPSRFDTLEPTGTVTGTLAAIPGSDAPAFISVYGLDHIVRTDGLGRFSLTGLPRGKHRLHATAAVPGWGWPDQEIRIAPGRESLDLGLIPTSLFLAEDYAAWPYSLRLRLEVSGLGLAGTLRDFPVLIKLDSAHFGFARSAGADIRVAGAGGRHLDYELESWHPLRGEAALWVRLDSLDLAGPDPVLTVYWGKPGAPDLSEGRRVFRAYQGAWHLSGAPGSGRSAYADASPLALHAAGDAVAFDSAVSGLGAAFSGGLHVTVPEHPEMKPALGLSYSIWFRARSSDSTGGEMGSMGDNYGLRLLPDGNLYFYGFNDPLWTPGAPIHPGRYQLLQTQDRNLLDDRWHHAAVTFTADSLRLFCDGQVVARAAARGPLRYPYRNDFELGRHGFRTHDKDFQGALDEARFAPHGRSEAWLRLEFENQKPGSTLIRFE